MKEQRILNCSTIFLTPKGYFEGIGKYHTGVKGMDLNVGEPLETEPKDNWHENKNRQNLNSPSQLPEHL